MYITSQLRHLLCTVTVVLPSPVSSMFSSGMVMVTVQVYSPPCDVSRGEKERVLVSDCTEPDEFTHCTVGGLIRLSVI